MNYQHIYHAGNFADVLKHLVLLYLVEALQRKETPFCYFETHAGAGCYDLSRISARTSEYSAGISKLLPNTCQLPLVSQYLTIIKNLNPNGLCYYPGSPYLVNQLLRSQDRMLLCELNQTVACSLKKLFTDNKQAAVHQLDGYQGLKAFLPPKEKRGLILIDPPFEQANEFKHILLGLKLALHKFAQGVYAIWYPIKDQAHLQRFKRQLANLAANSILCVELAIAEINPMLPLSGCGMIIINAPWQIDKQLKNLLAWLQPLLTKQQGGFYQVVWLIPPP